MTKLLAFTNDLTSLAYGDARGVRIVSLETDHGVALSMSDGQLNLADNIEWPGADGDEIRAFSIALGHDHLLHDTATQKVALILVPDLETPSDRAGALGIGDRPKIKLGSVDVSGARQVPMNAVDMRQLHGGTINAATRSLEEETVIFLQLDFFAFQLLLRKSGSSLEVASRPLNSGNQS
jgi:hypothetical protein